MKRIINKLIYLYLNDNKKFLLILKETFNIINKATQSINKLNQKLK